MIAKWAFSARAIPNERYGHNLCLASGQQWKGAFVDLMAHQRAWPKHLVNGVITDGTLVYTRHDNRRFFFFFKDSEHVT